jgi:hypothetical protein
LPYDSTRGRQRPNAASAATIESSTLCLGNQCNMLPAIIFNQGKVKCGVQMVPYLKWETALLWPIIALGEDRDQMRRYHQTIIT